MVSSVSVEKRGDLLDPFCSLLKIFINERLNEKLLVSGVSVVWGMPVCAWLCGC